MRTSVQQLMNDSGWVFPASIWDSLSEYEKEFATIEFTGLRSLNYYVQRLRAVGFGSMRTVLDAACGMGQWSIAMSEINELVFGIDRNSERVKVGKALARNMGCHNCSFQIGSIDSLPYMNQSMNGIFCYGALMFANIPQTLAEFYRVLKPNGILYVNANSFGWYAHLLLDRGIRQRRFSYFKAGLRMLMRTFLGKTSQIAVGRRWLIKQINLTGFKVCAVDLEGHINFSKDTARLQPAYPAKFYGIDSILEVIAMK